MGKKLATNFPDRKTETPLISRKISQQAHPDLFMLGLIITEVETHKHLGISLVMTARGINISVTSKKKAWNRISVMRKLKFELGR